MNVKQNEIVNNLRRIWKALRLLLGRNEILTADFEILATEKLENSGLFKEVNGEYIKIYITNY